MSDRTEAELQARVLQSLDLSEWIESEVEGLQVPQGLRSTLVAASYDQAFEHHRSIAELIRINRYGSAYALLRPLFEAGTGGLWLEHCPDDRYVQELSDGRHTPQTKTMLAALAKHPTFKAAALRDLMSQGPGKIFHDFTHGGGQQLSRRVPNRRMETAYARTELIGTLFVADAMVLVAVEYAHAFYKLPALGAKATALLDALIGQKNQF